MDVGNDPFPRDEVTGLAAFENLEPVSALNVMPEPEPTPPAVPLPPVPRASNRPIGVSPATTGGDPNRPDKTEILNLDKEVEDGSELGWDEDEATSFFSPADLNAPAANGAAASAPAAPPTLPSLPGSPPAASLDMDWDEDEPPTRMRDDSMALLPPLGGGAASANYDASWADDVQRGTSGRFDDLATAGYAPVGVPVPSPPVGRPSPFPSPSSDNRQYLAPIAAPTVESLGRGGAPSPFSAASTTDTQKFSLPTSLSNVFAGRPAWMLVAAGAGVAVVLLLIGSWIFGGPSTADVTITTAPTDARVYIDGRPVSGTSSPFIANELTEGPHELVVQKDGFVEHRSTFHIEGGDSRALPPVALTAVQKEVGFAINSLPSGAAILIDGNPIGQVTPAKVTNITPGIHKLELQMPGHTTFELQVLVPESGILQLPIAELASNGANGRRAEAREAREPREPREAREPRESREVSDSSASKRRSRSTESAASEPAARGGGGTGMLRLNSRPWSQVYVDGRLVGNTPQMGLPLSPGNHSIKLVNSQMGLTKTFNVSVKSGQMVTKVVNLVD